MSHPLSVTIGESKIIERAFSAAGVTCHIYPDPDDAGRVVFKRLDRHHLWSFILNKNGYVEATYGVLPEIHLTSGVEALLQVLAWLWTEYFNESAARIGVAATRAALDAHTLIADADRREDSIDSGDAIDRCYDSVRVILPEYTTSSDIEPPTPQE